MMDFDQLVRKYLSGSLTDAELDEFRDLLQRVPEYRVELKQILELRSLIHDDTLKLNPPEELSNSVRAAVGGRFAQSGAEAMLRFDAMSLTPPADLSNSVRLAVGRKFAEQAEIEPEKKKKKKGAIWIPYRIAAGAFATASIAVILSISPTLFAPFSDRGAGDSAPIAYLRKLPAPPSGRSTAGLVGGPTSLGYSIDDRGATGRIPESRATSLASREGAPGTPAAGERSSGAATDLVRSVANGVERVRANSSGINRPPVDTAIGTESTPSNDKQESRSIAEMLNREQTEPELLGLNALEIIRQRVGSTDLIPYAPSSDTANVHVTPIGPAHAIAGIRTDSPKEDRRLLAVGVTLGSGSVDATSPTVLMGSSCYFSFSVSGSDRVGVEMGGSTFQQENSSRLMFGNEFAKQTQGRPAEDPQSSDPVKSPAGPATTPAPSVSQRLKQQITYGGVFYDRRIIKINQKWDVCGRVTFGGADGSLVGGVRAYGAFSPSKNVSLTMGVGSSALYDLTSKKTWGSANYGIYYGVETGF
jgi:hypothetical protein